MSETDLAEQAITLRVDGRKTGFVYDRSADRLDYTTKTLGYGKHTVRGTPGDSKVRGPGASASSGNVGAHTRPAGTSLHT